MIVLGGVDEAGLGPLLGPLCVAGAAFAFEDEASLAADPFEPFDLWAALGGAVSREPADDRHALVVGDSKVVHARNPRGERRLEATVLAFAAHLLAGRVPDSLAALSLDATSESVWRSRHPWLADGDPPLPHACSSEFLELRSALLARALAAARCAPAALAVRRVEPGELNREFERSGNKAHAAWHFASAALLHVVARARELGAREVRLAVDRQGGRAHYGPLLARLFQEWRVFLVEESDGVSRYRLEGEPRIFVTFEERAEARHFAVALASCLAKYTREVSMAALNAWFGARAPGLAPTAGYTTDGRRWLADAAKLVSTIERDLLVRQR
jgi:hypothetical protein